jgi:AcrR family transcriptional regulator
VSSILPGGDPEQPDELAQLPHGRHGLPPEFVEHNQRERLIASLTALVGEVGYAEATISATTTGAGVSSRTFYKYFATIEECFLAAFEKGLTEIRPAVSKAFESESEWPLKVRAAIVAGLAKFSKHPEIARLLTTEPFVAGPQVAGRHKAVVEELVPYLRAGRDLESAPEPLPDTTEKGLLGAASALISRHVLAGEGDKLPELAPDLTQFLLTPYLGPVEAHRVASA